MHLQPNRAEIEAHLRILNDGSPDGFREIRLIRPDAIKGDRNAISYRYSTTEDGIANAVDFAIEGNTLNGWNVYVTPNLLCDGEGTAKNEDVIFCPRQFIDADKNDAAVLLEALIETGLPLDFAVVTGTIPHERWHVYLSVGNTDHAKWSDMQERLAHRFNTDPSVDNTARIMRVAGTVNRPNELKRGWGYQTEVTKLIHGSGLPLTLDTALYDDLERFPRRLPVETVRQPGDRPQAVYTALQAGPGAIPVEVIEAALSVIPPVNEHGEGHRKRWLQVGYACRAAGDHARAAFDAWQSRSVICEDGDAWVWRTLKNPTPDSFVSLFSLAKAENPDWWRDGDVVEDWMRERARQLEIAQEPCPLERFMNRRRWMITGEAR